MSKVNQQDMEKAVRVIQDIAVMLTGASEYVCENRMLKRYSSDIETHLDDLDTYLSQLKKSFPGKIPEGFKPDTSLLRIREIALSMKGDDALQSKCRSGELGDELSMNLKELKAEIRNLQETLRGKASTYSFADRIGDQAVRFKPVVSALSWFTSFIGKMIALFIILSILAFVYLYATMESEDALRNDINKSLATLETQKDTLAKYREDYEQITRTINEIENKPLTREKKIHLLDLSTERKKVKERIEKGSFAIEKKGKELMEKKKELEKLRKKTFLHKLFKR
ncbi:MAG: hypothetical protein ACOC6B_05945 [Thermodesulfobacteriota bacterium]